MSRNRQRRKIVRAFSQWSRAEVSAARSIKRALRDVHSATLITAGKVRALNRDFRRRTSAANRTSLAWYALREGIEA